MPKYTFDNTVAELLAEPKVVEIIKDLFPQVLNNPLIEMAKPFKFSDILPMISGAVPESLIKEFKTRLEAIK